MATGRVIYQEICSSRRFNHLYNLGDSGRLAQIIYFTSYSHSDCWGHIPFDAETIKYLAMPGCDENLSNILYSMCLLVHIKLWDKPYRVNDELYIHIFNFEQKNIEGIRRRVRGKWPDESGVIPFRERKGDKSIPIQECVANADNIRKNSSFYIDPATDPELSGIFRKISESSVPFRETQKSAITPAPIFSFDDLNINNKKIRGSFLYKLYRYLGYDIDQLGRLLYRAKESANIYAFITSGLSSGWINYPCADEENNPAAVRAWIDNLFGISSKQQSRGASELISLSDIMKEVLDNE